MAEVNMESFIDYVENMTVLELSKLVKAMPLPQGGGFFAQKTPQTFHRLWSKFFVRCEAMGGIYPQSVKVLWTNMHNRW